MSWPGRMSFTRIVRPCRNAFLALSASTVLTACPAPDCPTVATSVHSDYARCLARNESVTGAAQVGEYTVLDIHLSAGFMSLGPSYDFKRLLHNGRPVVDNTMRLEVWSGREDPVFFADPLYSEGARRGQFQMVTTQGGKALIEHIGDPDESYRADYDYPYGYPLTADVRYFGAPGARDNAGYLLSAYPTRVLALPAAPDGGQTPQVGWLAGIAPDGKAYAYIDGYENVSAVLVVDAAGTRRALLPLPLTPMAPSAKYEHEFSPAWRWFGEQFKWERNARGEWIVAARAPAPAPPPERPAEALFTDPANGYRQCFSDDNEACLRGWTDAPSRPTRAGAGDDCCLSKYAWSPTTPARAFDAKVTALYYATAGASESGYQLMLDAPPAAVAASIARRLRARNGRFIQPEACPETIEGIEHCAARIEAATGWDMLGHDGIIMRVSGAAKKGHVFVTPDIAFAVFAMPDGGAAVATLARRALTAPAADRASARR